MPQILLKENTRIIVNLFTLISVLIFAVTSSYQISKWKTETDEKAKTMNNSMIRVESESKNRDKTISENVSIYCDISIQNQIVLSGIQTDLKWLINNSGGKK